MKLSALLLVNLLKSTYDMNVTGNVSDIPHLTRPSFIFPHIPPEDFVVYIADEESYGSFPIWDASFSNSLLIVLQERDSKLKFDSPNIASLYGAENISEVYLLVQKYFQKYSEWEEEIIHSFLNEKSLQRLMEISMPVFNNSLLVVGMDFTVYARANATSLPSNEKVLGSTESTAQSVVKLKTSEIYDQSREIDGAFYFPAHVTSLGTMGVNIKRYDKTVYRLVMLEDARKVIDGEGFLLEFLASLVDNLIDTASEIPSEKDRILKDILTDAINDKTSDYINISQRLEDEGWLHHHKYQCVFIELNRNNRNNEAYKPLMSYIDNTFGVSCAFIHLENILVFVNLTLSDFSTEELENIVRSFSKNHQIQSGLSRVIVGHMGLRRQYLQALSALRIGRQKVRNTLLHPFDDIALDYILQQVTRTLPGEMLCHPKILLLEESDLSKGTDYIRTLQIYLENQCNALQTANALFIHRSTMLYRLGRIKEMLGSDLKDPEELLHLSLSFRLINFEERRELLKKKDMDTQADE